MKAHKIEPKAMIAWLLSCMQSDLRIVEAFAEHDSGIKRLTGVLSRRPLKSFYLLKSKDIFSELYTKFE